MVVSEEPLLKPERSGDKLVVRLRRQCRDPSSAERLCVDLEALVDRATQAIVFKDMDISQNTFSVEQFGRIFKALSKPLVSIQILRLFGSATLDDKVCGLMAAWLVGAAALIELHLSDCAITRVGFDLLMDALAANPAIPRGGCSPVFMRLENNYISQEAFDVAISKGIAQAFYKTSPAGPRGKEKCGVMVSGDMRCRQKAGRPPDPKDAPAPKPVRPALPPSRDRAAAKTPKAIDDRKGSPLDAAATRGASADRGRGYRSMPQGAPGPPPAWAPTQVHAAPPQPPHLPWAVHTPPLHYGPPPGHYPAPAAAWPGVHPGWAPPAWRPPHPGGAHPVWATGPSPPPPGFFAHPGHAPPLHGLGPPPAPPGAWGGPPPPGLVVAACTDAAAGAPPPAPAAQLELADHAHDSADEAVASAHRGRHRRRRRRSRTAPRRSRRRRRRRASGSSARSRHGEEASGDKKFDEVSDLLRGLKERFSRLERGRGGSPPEGSRSRTPPRRRSARSLLALRPRSGSPLAPQAAVGSPAREGSPRGAPRRGASEGSASPVAASPGADCELSLPADWERHWDEELELFYYWNSATDESQWEFPESASVAADVTELPPGAAGDMDV